MAIDIFLKLEGIAGESLDREHKGEIELTSFSWGLSNTARTGATGQGAGKPSFQEFHFTSKVSVASPKLMLACADGRHIKEGLVTLRKAVEQKETGGVEFLFYKFDSVVITSVQDSGDTTDVPSEAVSFAFAKVNVEYKEQTATGGIGTVVDFAWDLTANKKV